MNALSPAAAPTRHIRSLLLAGGAGLMLMACGGGQYGDAEVTGGLGGRTFGDKVSAYHGTSYIVIVDTEIDCVDMSWVTRNYFNSNDPATSGIEFSAVQFSFAVDTEPSVGSFVFDGTQGDSPLDVWSLLNTNVPSGATGEVDAETANAYNLNITEVTEDGVTGTFDTAFPDGNAGGSFTTTFCRNVR